MLLILTGFLAGLVHVLSGPDHLAAISPLAIENKKSSWLIGLKWGFGHTSGVFIVGILALLFREAIPTELISSFSERIVGIVLIGIGVWGLQQIFSNKLYLHELGGINHLHFHSHQDKIHADEKKHFHTRTALIIGVVHGLAGSSHLLGVLPALALPTRHDAALYLISFGVGTILAMAGFSEALGRIAFRFSELGEKLYRVISISFSAVAIGIGIFWIVK